MREVVAVILSGGAGTRLWPLSTPEKPKQFHQIVGNRTLFEETVLRAAAVKEVNRLAVVCNETHQSLVSQLTAENTNYAVDIYLESEGRNTAPAIAAVAHTELKHGRDPVLLILPADHFLPDSNAFAELINQALPLAKQGYLVTFGVKPTCAETAYGYIQAGKVVTNLAGAYQVERFIEKPNAAVAAELIKDPSCTWNSGIFLMQASTYLKELKQYAPNVYEHSLNAVLQSTEATNVVYLNHSSFNKCANISVDYAVFEHSQKIATMTYRGSWSDLGSWSSVANIALSQGKAKQLDDSLLIQMNAMNNYVHTTKPIAIIGVSGISVIETENALLIVAHDQAQLVKDVQIQAIKKLKGK